MVCIALFLLIRLFRLLWFLTVVTRTHQHERTDEGYRARAVAGRETSDVRVLTRTASDVRVFTRAASDARALCRFFRLDNLQVRGTENGLIGRFLSEQTSTARFHTLPDP